MTRLSLPLREQLEHEGYSDLVEINGKVCGLLPFLFTTGLMVGLENGFYELRYCFEAEKDARAALERWDGEGHPTGPWIKAKGVNVDLLNPNFGVETCERPR